MQAEERQRILVVTTGGTFEKSYCEEEGSLANRESQLRAHLLGRLRLPRTEVEIKEIMAIDSLYMDDSHREQIWNHLSAEFPASRPIIVLHGTDTMEHTAAFCHSMEPFPPVPVIFTGAMVPLAFVDSDGAQNFIEALMAASMLIPGWYIAFHNQIFDVPHVKKDKKLRTFVSTV